MSLSCSCQEWDGDGWYYMVPNDFEKLTTKRGRCCKSCGERINPGSDCIRWDRYRTAEYEVEEKIYGDEDIPMAPWYHCERCGEIALNLSAVGYCVSPDENMPGLLREYHELTGFERAA